MNFVILFGTLFLHLGLCLNFLDKRSYRDYSKSNLLVLNTSVVLPGLDIYKIELQLGNPPQTFSFLYDVGHFESIIPGVNCTKCDKRNLFNESSSSTYKPNGTEYTDIDYIISKVHGYLATDFMFIPKTNISTNINFVIYDDFTNEFGINFDGVLGLEHNYKRSSIAMNSSLIDLLHKEGKISKRIVTQKIHNSSNGQLIIGDLSEEIYDNLKNYSTCALNSEMDSKWNCALQKLFLGDNTNDSFTLGTNNRNYEYTFFSTINNFIIASNSSLEYFNSTYFGNSTKDGKCRITLLNNYYVFKCKKASFNLSHFQDLNIVIDGFGYKIYAKDLFVSVSSDKDIQFLIYFKQDTSDWILGQPLLKNYQIVFDGETDVVGFFGGPVIDLNTTSWWWIFGIIVVVCLFIVGILSFCYFCRGGKQETDYGRQID
jgi:hypothetical protein